jgi:HAD superfamily phosphoserine phosphatase-like hydrolase
MEWKERASDNSFHEYELFMIASYDQALANISPEDFMAAVERVFTEYKQQTYTYTRNLIKSLKQDGYLLFAISASQIEIVEMLAKYYGFDDWGGSTYEIANGKFTGKKYVLKSEQKPLHLQKLIKEHGATTDGSIGVGDSEGDIAMLETVENPIAFNPSAALFEHAKAKGWKVVVERKNMVYELEPTDGLYVLE